MSTTTQTPYTPGKREISNPHVTVGREIIGRYIGAVTFRHEDAGNARLSISSDNAVLSLCEHLGRTDAVEVAEMLADGLMVEIVEALAAAREYIMSEAEKRCYDPPVPLELVADMDSALVRLAKLKTEG